MPADQNNWNEKTWLHRFAILAVSLVITTGTAISPALPAMQKAFSNYPATLVNMVATIQQIPAFIVLLMSAPLARKFGLKQMIGLGILLMGISGILPAFVPNLWFILGTRIIFGIGIGLINSLAITIVNIFYSGNDKAQMMGNRTSFETIGLCIVNILVGQLLNLSWQVSFLAYFFILIILVLFWRVVPTIKWDNPVDKNGKQQAEKVNFPVIMAGVFCAIMTMGLATVSVMTPAIVVDGKLGSATDASFVITVFTLVSMAMGFLFGQFFKLFHRFVLPIGLLFFTVGLLIMNFSQSLVMLLIGEIIVGGAFPLAGTYIFDIIDKLAPKNSNALANSVLLVGCNVGTAISPIVMGFLNPISPFSGAQPGIGLFGALIGIMMVIIFIVQLFKRAPKK
ncbi:MFS transporter (plasmid) [Nicoliella spurrieriana]|uniref:MFS transporter n=1 Tax=Nicoliella spurrieriana TaxID=2925830 RepID=A0A976RQW8_9LACO|nr:MFS transporter [Nicoliella spurrieriana]UQS86139.1 MFS transporter [Nicoliella spurrieriana]